MASTERVRDSRVARPFLTMASPTTTRSTRHPDCSELAEDLVRDREADAVADGGTPSHLQRLVGENSPAAVTSLELGDRHVHEAVDRDRDAPQVGSGVVARAGARTRTADRGGSAHLGGHVHRRTHVGVMEEPLVRRCAEQVLADAGGPRIGSAERSLRAEECGGRKRSGHAYIPNDVRRYRPRPSTGETQAVCPCG